MYEPQMLNMKLGDLVRVRYREEEDWTSPFHGIVFQTPDCGENCVWQMWCFERARVHIISPNKDEIEIVSSC